MAILDSSFSPHSWLEVGKAPPKLVYNLIFFFYFWNFTYSYVHTIFIKGQKLWNVWYLYNVWRINSEGCWFSNRMPKINSRIFWWVCILCAYVCMEYGAVIAEISFFTLQPCLLPNQKKKKKKLSKIPFSKLSSINILEKK